MTGQQLELSPPPERGATLSPDGVYRYHLWRQWGPDHTNRLTFVMLNPSTADANVDDPTIRRCIGFAKREGMDRLDVVNLYAYRATDPDELLAAPDPIGPDNAAHLRRVFAGSRMVVAAWGAWHDKRRNARRPMLNVADLGGDALLCLGTTKSGAPRHPLYVKADQPFITYWPGAGHG